jgi:NTE family protein
MKKRAASAVVSTAAKSRQPIYVKPASAGKAKPTLTPAQAARNYETVVLVLQGGGALGSYQCGVYEGLHEAGIRPDWFAGISIGAFNAALLAGNAPEDRIAKMHEFWNLICAPALPLPQSVFDIQQQATSWLSRSDHLRPHGQRGFFVPRSPPPLLAATGSIGATSFYDTAPLKQTLEALVDFDRLNHTSQRFTVGAVNVRTGNFVYFYNRKTKIQPEHVMASGALPPAFAAVEIDGEFYWDGGVVSNTPLEYVVEDLPRRDTLALQVDLWNARGTAPSTIMEALERQKDIQYSSRTRRGTDVATERQRLRLAISQLIELIPANKLTDELKSGLESWTCDKVLNVVHLIYKAKNYEEQYKDYSFGADTMREHWQAGLDDMEKTLQGKHYFDFPGRDVGVVTHDVHR